MQVEIEKLIEKYAKKYNISKRDAELIYKTPYKMMLDNNKGIDVYKPSSLEVNTYLMFLGTFYVNKNKAVKLREKLDEITNKSTR